MLTADISKRNLESFFALH